MILKLRKTSVMVAKKEISCLKCPSCIYGANSGELGDIECVCIIYPSSCFHALTYACVCKYVCVYKYIYIYNYYDNYNYNYIQ